jgi:hypothetical protein
LCVALAGGADEGVCAKTILSALARRAYRRPVTDAELSDLLTFFNDGRSDEFEAGIGLALRRRLVKPAFLFRIERDPSQIPPATAYRISDLDLASRLSFFLWSSIPGDELLDVATRGLRYAADHLACLATGHSRSQDRAPGSPSRHPHKHAPQVRVVVGRMHTDADHASDHASNE